MRIRSFRNKSKLIFFAVLILSVILGSILMIQKFKTPKITQEPVIKLYLSGEDRVIELALEEYLAGTVAAEMPAGFGPEALKAQAVCARTYA
ncbi:MAG TPA: stage II sporulation protein D, partial [Syntrophomonas sp.]|nr:stage II sporulation protein D [Syntrophomonas sp.]